MGCDGGVLAMQRKFMRGLGHKMGEKPSEEVSRRFRALIRGLTCAVSGEQLRDPIVSCELGHLYNKEAVLLALLERTLNPAFNHIRGMKDLIPCRFTHNPNWVDETAASIAAGGETGAASEAKGETGSFLDEDVVAKFICPVTRVEMNAKQPFVVLRTTGWVLSERALKEIGAANLQGEYGPFEMEDIIRLIPEDEEEAEMRRRMNERRAKAKKEKKRKHGGGGEDGGEKKDEETKEERKKRKADKAAAKQARLTNGATAAAAALSHVSSAPMGLKVASLAAEAQKVADDQMANSSSLRSLFNSGKESATDKNRLLSVRR